MIARWTSATGIMILYILFSSCLNSDCPSIYIEAASKRNTSAASPQLRHLGRSMIAVALFVSTDEA